MTYAEIHTLVAHGEPLPPFQSLPDLECYESLACLKKLYELTGMNEKTVKCHKQDIRRAHKEAVEAFEQYMAVYREYNDNNRKTGQDIKAILDGLEEENPNYQELFLLSVNCIGRMQNGEHVTRMICEKMKRGI